MCILQTYHKIYYNLFYNIHHFGIQEITIGNNCQYNGDTFIIKGLEQLKRIIIGDGCMDSVIRFELKSIISNCEYNESIFLI